MQSTNSPFPLSSRVICSYQSLSTAQPNSPACTYRDPNADSALRGADFPPLGREQLMGQLSSSPLSHPLGLGSATNPFPEGHSSGGYSLAPWLTLHACGLSLTFPFCSSSFPCLKALVAHNLSQCSPQLETPAELWTLTAR